MTTTRTARLLATLIAAGLLASPVAFDAFRADGAPKPPEAPFCDGSDPGYCNPVDVDPARAIPPDLPIEAKLRAQLVRERKAHRVEVRGLRAQIVRLGGR